MTTENHSKMNVDPGSVREVLDGDVSKLDVAFVWSESPQGYDHWCERCTWHINDEMTPLTESDLAFLRSLLEE